MIPVYSADSSLDAQLVQDLLVNAGITAHLLGPAVVDLRTGAGGTHRVAVEEEEAEAARQLIADWQTGPADDEDGGFDLLDSLPLEDEA
jgi:hypothetical protein